MIHRNHNRWGRWKHKRTEHTSSDSARLRTSTKKWHKPTETSSQVCRGARGAAVARQSWQLLETDRSPSWIRSFHKLALPPSLPAAAHLANKAFAFCCDKADSSSPTLPHPVLPLSQLEIITPVARAPIVLRPALLVRVFSPKLFPFLNTVSTTSLNRDIQVASTTTYLQNYKKYVNYYFTYTNIISASIPFVL